MAEDTVATANGVTATLEITADERRLQFEYEGRTAVIVEPREGYSMLAVSDTPTGPELERYYGFDMALDHVAELLGIAPHAVPVPAAAEDMGI